MTTQQPEALRLANMLEKPGYGWHSTPAECAAELQRLQSENEQLRAGYDAARLEIASLRERVQQLGQLARDVNSRRVQELEAQLAAVGAGGVEPLRKRECLHQISEPAPPKFSTRDDAERLKSVARGMSYNDIGEAVWKYTLLEIAMRLETGGYVAPQPAAQALDSVRVFWQQHTQADALSMTMAELHADVELVIRAARGAAQAAPVDAERLDYLQECGVTVEVLPGRPGWTFRIGGLHGTVHRSVRTAIDAARAAQEGK